MYTHRQRKQKRTDARNPTQRIKNAERERERENDRNLLQVSASVFTADCHHTRACMYKKKRKTDE